MANRTAPARVFAEHLNRMLNTTVTDGRLVLTRSTARPDRFVLASFAARQRLPLALRGSDLSLTVEHELDVVGERCRTVGYRYRLQRGQRREHWLLRWEYDRYPPTADYRYPSAHVHFNATFRDPWASTQVRKTADHLHAPTSRVSLEAIVWHAIAEWGVEPRTGDWKHRLDESLAIFGDDGRERLAPGVEDAGPGGRLVR